MLSARNSEFCYAECHYAECCAPTKGRFSFAHRYESTVEAIDEHSSLVQY